MSDKDSSTKKLKSLKAKLGRGEPSRSSNPSMVPPPSVPGITGVVPPRVGTGGSWLGAAGGAQNLGVPSFLQQGGTQAPQGQNEVRLVIDEGAVDESEVGKRQRGRGVLLLAVGVVLGALVGGGIGSVNADRKQYNLAVRDGSAVYKSVRKASTDVVEVKNMLEDAITVVRGKGGAEDPRVPYEILQKLRAIEKPFGAADFARKRYSTFSPTTVDQLFDYNTKVESLWAAIETMTVHALMDSNRAELDRATSAAKEALSTPTGCIPSKTEGRISCELVFVSPRPDGTVGVGLTKTGPRIPKTLYRGGSFGDNPEQYVILTNTSKSLGVLGQQAGAFADFQKELLLSYKKAQETTEVQGRLEEELSKIARLEPVFAL